MNLDILTERILQAALIDNGITLDHNGNIPSEGYMVSLHGHESVIDMETPISLAHQLVRQYLESKLHIEFLPSNYFGFWVNDGMLYMDISQNIQHLEIAIDMGRLNEQLAIYDLNEGVEIGIEL